MVSNDYHYSCNIQKFLYSYKYNEFNWLIEPWKYKGTQGTLHENAKKKPEV